MCARSVSLSSRNLGQRERAYVEGQMRTLDEGLQLKQQLAEEGVLLWREKQVHRIPLYGTTKWRMVVVKVFFFVFALKALSCSRRRTEQ